MPKFLRFKLHRKALYSSQFYKSWMIKLLDKEIREKELTISSCKECFETELSALLSESNIWDRIVIKRSLDHSAKIFTTKTKIDLDRKLEKLCITNQLRPCDPDKTVQNYSSILLPARIKTLLAFGLDFGIPVFKLDYYKFFTPLESLAYRLSKEKCASDISDFFGKMSNIAQKFFHTFKPHKVFSPVISREDLQLLKDFSKKSNIIVSPPDKGNGVVVLDKSTYISSMMNIVGDATKFKLISEPIEGLCRKVEGKINRFLYGIKDKRVITDDAYQKLRSTGSGPGVMYGQPKTHKKDFSTKFQCRPIMAAYNLASYKIAKFIVPILSPFTTNQYTILNSTEFSRKISSIPNADQLFMASFDIDSLFTNIPLHETIGICLQKLFSDPGVSTVFGFTDKLFKTLLEHAVFNSFFLFNDN